MAFVWLCASPCGATGLPVGGGTGVVALPAVSRPDAAVEHDSEQKTELGRAGTRPLPIKTEQPSRVLPQHCRGGFQNPTDFSASTSGIAIEANVFADDVTNALAKFFPHRSASHFSAHYGG